MGGSGQHPKVEPGEAPGQEKISCEDTSKEWSPTFQQCLYPELLRAKEAVKAAKAAEEALSQAKIDPQYYKEVEKAYEEAIKAYEEATKAYRSIGDEESKAVLDEAQNILNNYY